MFCDRFLYKMLIRAELEAIYTNMKVQKMAIPSDITFFFRERI